MLGGEYNNYYCIITSKLANQHAPKALVWCIIIQIITHSMVIVIITIIIILVVKIMIIIRIVMLAEFHVCKCKLFIKKPQLAAIS